MILGWKTLPCNCGSFASTSEIGEGTQYPKALSLQNMMDLFWKNKTYTASGSFSWGASCEICDKSDSATIASEMSSTQVERAGGEGSDTQFDLLCSPTGSYSWSPTLLNSEGEDANATVTAMMDLCDVKYFEGSYYPKMVFTFTGTLVPDSDSGSGSDSYSTSSPPEKACPSVTVVSDWLTYTVDPPANIGEWSIGGVTSVSLYVVPTPPEEGEEPPEGVEDCDVEDGTSVSVSWAVDDSYIPGNG